MAPSKAALIVSVAAALGLAASVSSQLRGRIVEAVLFQPSSGVDIVPADIGVPASEVRLRAEDGVWIHAFDVPSLTSDQPADRAILFLHGNAGNASHRLPNVAQLAALGVRVLLIDYRGYGLSEGRATIDGVLLDAQAGLAHLVDSGLPEERIVLFGRSLGGAVAVQLARKRPLGGVILESTFSSMRDVARSAFGPFLGPLAGWLAGEHLDSVAAIRELRCPLLAFHGDADRIVPYHLGVTLFEAAPEPKQFEKIAGAGHNDTTIIGGTAYFEKIAAFLDEVVPPR